VILYVRKRVVIRNTIENTLSTVVEFQGWTATTVEPRTVGTVVHIQHLFKLIPRKKSIPRENYGLELLLVLTDIHTFP
jgi:hypothetical protein